MEIDTQEGSGAQRVFSHEDIQRVVQSVCTVDPPAVPLDFCQDQAVAVIRALHAEGTSLVQTFQATQKRVGEEAEAREKELKEKSDQVRRFVGHVKRLSEGLQQANEEAHARDIELAREKGEVPRRLEARTLQYLEGCKYGIDAYFPELLKGSPGEWTDAASHDFVKFLEEQESDPADWTREFYEKLESLLQEEHRLRLAESFKLPTGEGSGSLQIHKISKEHVREQVSLR